MPFCAACGTPVPDLETNHHVCVSDGQGGYIKSTRDLAAAAQERAVIEDTTIPEAFSADAAGTPVTPAPVTEQPAQTATADPASP